MSVTLRHGDCLDVLRTLPDCSVDSIVTDPPYGLGFMGKAWDDLPPGVEWAAECLRVLKPGGHILAFGGSRTWHRLASAIEDAGFEIRDSIAWMHGQGFPKGRGQLKPAFEPVVVGRKKPAAPRTGLLQIDSCRVEVDPADPVNTAIWTSRPSTIRPGSQGFVTSNADGQRSAPREPGLGRWPANVVLDESQADRLDQSSRFFYVAKAPKSERPRTDDGTAHPTVKPLALMRWLVRLVTPPGGTVLEPFAGSGTTVEACILEGFHCVAIEREADYLPLIEARIARATA